MSKISLDSSECVWQRCKGAKHVTDALDVRMLSEGPFIADDNNRWFYLKGKSCRVYFSVAFCLFDNILIVVSVYYADTRISRSAGCSSKIMRSSSKRDDAVNIMEKYSDRLWQTLPPYESDFLLVFKDNDVRKLKNVLKSQWSVLFLFFWWRLIDICQIRASDF